jgi:hypothetical protein
MMNSGKAQYEEYYHEKQKISIWVKCRNNENGNN